MQFDKVGYELVEEEVEIVTWELQDFEEEITISELQEVEEEVEVRSTCFCNGHVMFCFF